MVLEDGYKVVFFFNWDWVGFFLNDWVNLVFFLQTHNQVFFSLSETFDPFNFINKYTFPWIYRKLKKQLLSILHMFCGQKWANWKLTLRLEDSKIVSIKLVDVKCPAFQVVGLHGQFWIVASQWWRFLPRLLQATALLPWGFSGWAPGCDHA